MIIREVNAYYVDGTDTIECPPVFFSNKNYVLFAWNELVLCYNSENGEKITEFKTNGSKVIFIGFDPKNENTLITCTENGIVQLFNIETSCELEQFNLNKSIYTFELFKNINEIKALVTWPSSTNEEIEASIITLNQKTETVKLPFSFNKKNYKICIGYNFKSNYVAAVFDNALIVMENLRKNMCRKHLIFNNQLMNLICHSKKPEILTCDNLGRILIWNDIFTSKPIKTYYHWHTLPVPALSLSHDGTKFLSGGSECVLVKWTRDDFRNKEFIPRISAPICHLSLSKNGNCAAIVTEDNAVHIVDVEAMRIVCEIRRFERSSNFLSQLHFDTKSQSLVLNSYVGHLAFYNPYQMSVLFDLDITNMNKFTQERDTEIKNTEIRVIAFNKNCNWLATVEEFSPDDEDLIENQVFLKFWLFNSHDQNFELNSIIRSPHDDYVINYIEFSNEESDENLLCVTIGKNKHVNIWKIFEKVSEEGKKMYWMCIHSVFYQNLDSTAASFSCNSQLLAANFGMNLTIWSMISFNLKYIKLLEFSVRDSPIKFLKFDKFNNCNTIVIANDYQLIAWNLLILKCLWSVDISIQYICVDPFSKFYAIFTHDHSLIVFTADSKKFVCQFNNILEENLNVKAAAFIPKSPQYYQSKSNVNWLEQSNIYFISGNKLYMIDEEMNRKQTQTNLAVYVSTEAYKTPLAESLMKNVKSFTNQTEIKSHQFNDQSLHQTIVEQFLQQPCYAIDSLESYSEIYLSSLLKRESEDDNKMIIDDNC